ncbi:hypothetical protein Dcar01_03557 [Deinococcus carri]|uniref:Phage recombination protein Bet n=1 Tax=Deinococcus carri TaxID=1211323 RepID=A0ABP9WCD3_9DEIO
MTASAIQPTTQHLPLAQPTDFSNEQVDLIKQTVAAGTSDLELALFLEVAKSSGLNPFQRQIYAVMRWDAKTRKEKMVIQTGIDGYRLIAARSGVHMGTTDPEFGPVSKEGFPEFARVIVRKLVHGHVAEFPATARWSEYVQMGKEGPTAMWKRMPHTMLGKCAEALALRKAFPAELSGVYSDVEMAQADNPAQAAPAPQSRRADVTREVADAAGVQPQTLPDPQQEEALKAWASKIGDLAARVRKVAPAEDVQHVLDTYERRASIDGARACYDNLKELGLKYAQQRQEAPAAAPAQQGEVVDAEFTPAAGPAGIHDGQRKALMGYLNRAGIPDSSEARSAFYTHMAPNSIPAGTRTNALTFEQARGLLELLGAMDASDLAQTGAEFLKDFDLPF